MNNQNLFRRSYQKKFDAFKNSIITIPPQGWIKTIREFFGMTTSQFAQKIDVSQPRVINMEKNEKNIKISTMERIADSINCEFIYAFIPRENIKNIHYNQAKKTAIRILNKVNKNMELENQFVKNNELLEDLIQELLNGNISKIWEEE